MLRYDPIKLQEQFAAWQARAVAAASDAAAAIAADEGLFLSPPPPAPPPEGEEIEPVATEPPEGALVAGRAAADLKQVRGWRCRARESRP